MPARSTFDRLKHRLPRRTRARPAWPRPRPRPANRSDSSRSLTYVEAGEVINTQPNRPVGDPLAGCGGAPPPIPESASELCAPEGSRTLNLLIRRHRPRVRPGTIRVLLSCRCRCREARLSSSLGSELSSAQGCETAAPLLFLSRFRSCRLCECFGAEVVQVVLARSRLGAPRAGAGPITPAATLPRATVDTKVLLSILLSFLDRAAGAKPARFQQRVAMVVCRF